MLPEGTAYVTDAGMTGARDSVLGFEISASHRLFLSGMPTRLPVEEKSGKLIMNSVMIEIDDATGRARSIQRVDREHTLVS
jgi:calcineurin-like phosphoesterase